MGLLLRVIEPFLLLGKVVRGEVWFGGGSYGRSWRRFGFRFRKRFDAVRTIEVERVREEM